jgi:hypothetical protein
MRDSLKRKILLCTMVFVFSVIFGMLSVSAAETTSAGTFEVESAIVDDKVEMTVKAVNLKSVAAVQLDVTYDVETLTYESFEAGTDVEDTMVYVGEESEGTLTIAYIDNAATDAGAEGTVLAVLTFSIKDGVTATTTPVTLTLEELYAEPSADTTQNRADATNTEVRATYGDPTDVAAFVPEEEVDVPLVVVDGDGTFVLTSEIVDGNVQMTVKAVDLKSVAVAQVNVAYDTATLTYESYEAGTGSDDAMVSVGEKTEGVATVVYINNSSPDAGEDGLVLAVLTFSVKDGVTATTTPVTLTLQELYGEATSDSTLNRALADNSAVRATYGDPADVTELVPAETVDVELPEVEDVLLGDVTEDGEVTADDAAFVVQYVVGGELTASQLLVADVTGDGEVTADDAAFILKYVIGAIESFD